MSIIEKDSEGREHQTPVPSVPRRIRLSTLPSRSRSLSRYKEAIPHTHGDNRVAFMIAATFVAGRLFVKHELSRLRYSYGNTRQAPRVSRKILLLQPSFSDIPSPIIFIVRKRSNSSKELRENIFFFTIVKTRATIIRTLAKMIAKLCATPS